ncbi:MAG: hypothetical protein ACOC3Z_03135 [Nanoarchaeota archaeon]
MQIYQPYQLSSLDYKWDCNNPKKRKENVLKNAINTVLFSKKCIPFYINHYKNISENKIEKINTLEEFTIKLPHVTKEHISYNPHQVFMPDRQLIHKYFGKKGVEELYELCKIKGIDRNYGTGGTTGKPTTIIHTSTDWRAMKNTFLRSLMFDFQDNLNDIKNLTAYGLYHGDHITNKIWESALTSLNINMYGRASTKSSAEHNYELIQEIKPNILIGPSEDSSGKQTKGITLDTILKLDARNPNSKWPLNHKENPDFKMILWSSMPMSKELSNYILNHLEIPYMHAHYGNTEVGSVSVSCLKYPLNFHLCYGSNIALIKTEKNDRLTKINEKGVISFSKISGETKENKLIVPSGMTLINYLPGNFASIIKKDGIECKCSNQKLKRNTEIIMLHGRDNEIKEKPKMKNEKNGYLKYNEIVENGKNIHGCQVD